MAITATFLNSNFGNPVSTVSVTPTAVGDLLVCWVSVSATNPTVTGLSGGGVTTWTLAHSDGDGTYVAYAFYGVVTSTGAATITAAFSSAIGTNYVDIYCTELSDGTPRTWTIPAHGLYTAPSATTTITYATLTAAGSGGNQIYIGYGATATAITGTTGAFTQTLMAASGNAYLSGVVTVGSSNTPTGQCTPAWQSGGHGIIVQASTDAAAGSIAGSWFKRRRIPPGMFRAPMSRPFRRLPDAGPDLTPPAVAPPVQIAGTKVTPVVSVAVQAAFGKNASDVLVEGDWVTLDRVVDVEVNRPASRNLGVLVRYEASTCRVVLDNQNRDYDPDNRQSPYSTLTQTLLLPMTPVRVIAQTPVEVDGLLVDIGGSGGTFDTDYPLFRGYADSWKATYSAAAKTSQTILTATDGTKVLSRYNGPAQTSAGAGERTGNRVGRILDNAGWPAELRAVDAGLATLQATTLATPAWTELLLTADSERGDIFIDTQGRVTFYGQTRRGENARSNAPTVTWGNGSTQTLRYSNPRVTNDDTLIVNEVSIANVGGTAQTVTDATSQAMYLPRSLNRTDLLLQTDGAALAYATALLAQLKDPYLRIEGIDYTPGSLEEQADNANVVFGVQVADRWKVVFEPPGGGSPIVRDVWVVGMRWHFTQASFDASFTFQPVDLRVPPGFIADDPVYGVADDAIELAY